MGRKRTTKTRKGARPKYLPHTRDSEDYPVERHSLAPWHGLFDMLPLRADQEKSWATYLKKQAAHANALDRDGTNIFWRAAQIGDALAVNVLLREGFSSLAAERDAKYGIDSCEVALIEGHATLAKSIRPFCEKHHQRLVEKTSPSTPRIKALRKKKPPRTMRSTMRGLWRRVGRRMGLVRRRFERETSFSEYRLSQDLRPSA